MPEKTIAWARVAKKTCEPLTLSLDLVCIEATEVAGTADAMRVDQLADLLLPGDRMEVVIHLAPNRHGDDEPTVKTRAYVR